jgi:hypothetical protein
VTGQDLQRLGRGAGHQSLRPLPYLCSPSGFETSGEDFKIECTFPLLPFHLVRGAIRRHVVLQPTALSCCGLWLMHALDQVWPPPRAGPSLHRVLIPRPKLGFEQTWTFPQPIVATISSSMRNAARGPWLGLQRYLKHHKLNCPLPDSSVRGPTAHSRGIAVESSLISQRHCHHMALDA